MELNSIEIWAIIGVVLLVAEIFAVSFFFMFFGIGALAVSLTTFLDITPDMFSQVMAFIILSLVSMLFFRKQLRELFFRKEQNYQEMVNEKAKVSVAIPQNAEGKVFYRGADWIAEEISGLGISKGEQVLIKKVDGIRLIVQKI